MEPQETPTVRHRISLRALLLPGILFISLGGIAGAEDLEITTYYPSPRGVYDELRTTGDVGVGTLTPSQRLHVVGTGVPTNVWIENSGTPGQWVALGANSPTSVDLSVGGKDLFINNDPGIDPTNTFINAGLGNVGIGLSTPPSAKLQVVSPAGLNPLRVDTATAAPAFLVNQDGRVFIASNTTEPEELIVSGGILVLEGLPGDGNNKGGLSFSESSKDTGVFSSRDGEIILFADGVRALDICAKGDPSCSGPYLRAAWPLGVGMVAPDLPSAELHVVKRGAGINSFRVDDGFIGEASPFVIDSAGNVGIGMAAPAAKLDVAGNAAISGEATIGGVANDGNGAVVCIKADKTLGTCDVSGVPGLFGGTCLCN